MKKILLILCIMALALILCVKPMAIFFAKERLRRAFPGSEVLIGSCEFKPHRLLALTKIEVKKDGICLLSVKRIEAHYTPVSLFCRRIDRLYFKQARYDKLKIANLEMSLRFKGKNLFIDTLSADIFGGKLEAVLTVMLTKPAGYVANLDLKGLDLETIIKDFDLGEKLELTGKLGGTMAVKGEGQNFTILQGSFSTTAPGGLLAIKDDSILKNMARNSEESLDLIVESFKNYHYNTGIMKLFLDKGNLIFKASLEGETGKRNLTVVVHDLIK